MVIWSPSFPPQPRAEREGRKEAGRKDVCPRRTHGLNPFGFLLCFNLCGRRHMQRWFCSCGGGSRRAARVHQRSAFSLFLSVFPLGASPARPVHNDYFFGFTMQNCPFFLLTVLQQGQERSCQAKGVRGKKKASCLCRAKLTVTACSAEGLFRYCCCFPSSQHGNGQCNELTASCCKVGSRKAP